MHLRAVGCLNRLAKEWDAEYQRRIAERNKAGPQFTRGAPEPAKKLPYGLGNGETSCMPVLMGMQLQIALPWWVHGQVQDPFSCCIPCRSALMVGAPCAGGSQAAIFAAQAKAQALASSAGAKRSKWDTVPKR